MRALTTGFALAALAVGVSGCSEYLERRDTLSLGAGNAVQTNIATHVIDPWPAASRRIRETTDGDRTQRAVERYRTTPGGASSGLGQGSTASQPSTAPSPTAGTSAR